MELLISVLGIVSAVITVSLTNYYSKKSQLKFEERKLKEDHYINFINALSKIVISKNNEKDKDILADCQNKLLLIGSTDVVNRVMIFQKYVNSPQRHDFPPDLHDKLLTDLLKAMREDLFQSSKVNKKYTTIHLSGRTNKES